MVSTLPNWQAGHVISDSNVTSDAETSPIHELPSMGRRCEGGENRVRLRLLKERCYKTFASILNVEDP
jgi:hypothetical protein